MSSLARGFSRSHLHASEGLLEQLRRVIKHVGPFKVWRVFFFARAGREFGCCAPTLHALLACSRSLLMILLRPARPRGAACVASQGGRWATEQPQCSQRPCSPTQRASQKPCLHAPEAEEVFKRHAAPGESRSPRGAGSSPSQCETPSLGLRGTFRELGMGSVIAARYMAKGWKMQLSPPMTDRTSL